MADDPQPVRVINPELLFRYTDPAQFAFFRYRINAGFGWDCNVRFDPDDPSGTTIRWFHDYRIPLGGFLYEGRSAILGVTEEQARWLAPLPEFSPTWAEFGATEPEPAPEPEVPDQPLPDADTETGS